MRTCEHCGAQTKGPSYGACDRCYRAGAAAHVDPAPVAAHIAGLRADGWAWLDIADAVGCSRQTVWKIQHGRVRSVRQWVADAVLAIPRPERCPVCEDVEIAAQSTDDPALVAARIGKSMVAIERHLYRHGRNDLARMFNRNNREKAAQ